MICKKCNKEGTGRFCSHCGTPFEKEHIIRDAIAEFERERIEEEKRRKKEVPKDNQHEKYNKNNTLGNKSNHSVGGGKRTKSSVQKAKPKKKSVSMPNFKVLTKTFKKTISRGLQMLSFLCMLGIGIVLFISFFERKSKFGVISTMLEERNYSLATFLICMGGMIGFAVISMFWIASKRKFLKDERMKSFDSGRGIIPFLCYGIAVLIAPGILKVFPTSYEVLQGLEESLQILYDNTKILRTLVVVGIVTCFLRKIMKI